MKHNVYDRKWQPSRLRGRRFKNFNSGVNEHYYRPDIKRFGAPKGSKTVYPELHPTGIGQIKKR